MEAPASLGSLGLARESAEAPRRIAAGRAEWMRLMTLAEFRDEWRDLSHRALEPNVFYDPAFALAAAPVFGANAGAVLVWSKATPTRLIGLFPARITRRYGMMTALAGWTHPYAPFGVPLVDREEADAAVTAFLDHIEADPKFPRLVMLPLIARNGPFAAVLTRVLLRHGGALAHFGEHARALLEPTAGRLRYLDHAVGGKKHKELRRQRRRLLDKGLLKVTSAREANDIPRALSDYLALEAAGWKGRAGSAVDQSADIRAFMQTAIEALSADGHARIDRLMQNGHPLAATITLRSGDCAWFWKIAYDEDFAKFSPGVQVSLDLTELLLAEPDIARVDSCATADHPMIDHIWRERLALADLLIAPSAAAQGAFAIALHLETLRRAFIAAAKHVRDSVRR
jgi:CelD/BcsL family acetyltransferase involved in cellulose biosynthesis